MTFMVWRISFLSLERSIFKLHFLLDKGHASIPTIANDSGRSVSVGWRSRDVLEVHNYGIRILYSILEPLNCMKDLKDQQFV